MRIVTALAKVVVDNQRDQPRLVVRNLSLLVAWRAQLFCLPTVRTRRLFKAPLVGVCQSPLRQLQSPATHSHTPRFWRRPDQRPIGCRHRHSNAMPLRHTIGDVIKLDLKLDRLSNRHLLGGRRALAMRQIEHAKADPRARTVWMHMVKAHTYLPLRRLTCQSEAQLWPPHNINRARKRRPRPNSGV